LSSERRTEKGRLLRNGALSFVRAATKAKRTEAAWMRERATQLLRLYDREKLYESEAVRRATLQLRQKIQAEIGYADLSIVTNNPQAKACLKGYRFQECKIQMIWNLRVRPGRYALEATYPGGAVEKRALDLGPMQRETVVLSPPTAEGQITIVSNAPNAMMRIEGGELSAPIMQTGNLWVPQLKPGSYVITITYPGQSPQSKPFIVAVGKPVALIFNPPGPPAVRVVTQPDGVSVFVGGQYRGKTDIRLLLKEGKQEIVLRKTCYLERKVSVEAIANQEKQVNLKMERDPAFLVWQKNQQGLRGRQIFGWSMLAGGIVIGGVGGAMHGVATIRHNDAEARRAAPSTFAQYQSLAEEGNTFRTIGHVGVGVGGAAVIVGVVGLFLAQSTPLSEVPCKVRLQEE
jgi:hypothetical protein